MELVEYQVGKFAEEDFQIFSCNEDEVFIYFYNESGEISLNKIFKGEKYGNFCTKK